MQITKKQYSEIDSVRFEMSSAYKTLKFLTEACNSMVEYPHAVDMDEMFGGLYSILDNITHKIRGALKKTENILYAIEKQQSAGKEATEA